MRYIKVYDKDGEFLRTIKITTAHMLLKTGAASMHYEGPALILVIWSDASILEEY